MPKILVQWCLIIPFGNPLITKFSSQKENAVMAVKLMWKINPIQYSFLLFIKIYTRRTKRSHSVKKDALVNFKHSLANYSSFTIRATCFVCS